jgi:plastocyanin
MVRGIQLVGVLMASTALGCGGSAATAPATHSPTGGSSTGTSSSVVASVGIRDGAFAPSVDTVRVGTVVSWTNNGTVAHTVTSDGGLWNSGQISSAGTGGVDAYGYPVTTTAGSFDQTFSTAGSYAYHCSNHPGMTGTVVVTP